MLLTMSPVEAAGYGARIASAGDVTQRGVFIIQFCLIILAPVLMAGVVYLVFGRIVFHVVPAEARTFKLLWVPGTSPHSSKDREDMRTDPHTSTLGNPHLRRLRHRRPPRPSDRLRHALLG